MADRARIRWMTQTAYQSMEAGRDSRAKKIRRSMRRSWQYGGGKKTAAKIAVGAAFGAVFVGVSVATAGAGAPVVAALAVGGFMVGQMSDAGFAKLSGRKYRGAKKTNSWMEKYRQMNEEEQKESLHSLDERAHKTIRRAFEHFRRGIRKAQAFTTAANQANADRTCDAASEMVLSALHASHHFDKARLYAFPAFFLCELLLRTYGEYLQLWRRSEAGVLTRVGELLDEHNGNACESSVCFAVAPVQPIGVARPSLWDQGKIDELTNKVQKLDDKLTAAGFAPAPPAPSGARAAVDRAHQLFMHAGTKYHRERRRLRVKMKHGVTTMWARKTTGERRAFVGSRVVSAGLAAAGGGVGGAGLAAESAGHAFPAWVDPITELTSQVTENVLGQGIDAATADGDAPDAGDIAHHKEGTAVGAASQENLKKAAVHLYEIVKLVEQLKSSEKATDCDSALARLREAYKIEHHLAKTQTYLEASIKQADFLGTKLAEQTDQFKQAHDAAFALAVRIVGRTNHADCGSVCYGPKGQLLTMPARPLT